MNVQIEHCDDFTVITPILRILRDTLPTDVFEDRLSRAMLDGYRVLVTRNAAGVGGCLGYRITRDVFWGKTLDIDDLAVCPEARDKGVGATLLNASKEEARLNSCDHVRLCSGLSRTHAHRFYERNGFDRSSVQFSYAIQDGEN